MTAWLYALRAASLAICGSEKQHTNAMTAAETTAEYPDYRAKLKLAHAKLREQRDQT
jgi:hypothetical protein